MYVDMSKIGNYPRDSESRMILPVETIESEFDQNEVINVACFEYANRVFSILPGRLRDEKLFFEIGAAYRAGMEINAIRTKTSVRE